MLSISDVYQINLVTSHKHCVFTTAYVLKIVHCQESMFTCNVYFYLDKPRNVRVLIKSNHGVVSLNDTALIQCEFDANPPPHDFSFYLNGSLIQSESANVYTIKRLKASDIGNYSCVTTNTLGVGPNASALLIIGGKLCYFVSAATFFRMSYCVRIE